MDFLVDGGRRHPQKKKPLFIQGKHGKASATPQSRKNPVFDCTVALCTTQNASLVISNLT
jgi:hypothetical protein